VRRDVLGSPVDVNLEENGNYARIDDIDEAITEVLTEVCEMEDCDVDMESPVPFHCDGKRGFSSCY